MPRCPFCGHLLTDVWVARRAASLMGRTRGPTKARTNAKAAAQARWDRVRVKNRK
jgi:hypothetical protein